MRILTPFTLDASAQDLLFYEAQTYQCVFIHPH